MKAFKGGRVVGRRGVEEEEVEEGGAPQVAQDKRCFPLNKETVKNTFVCVTLVCM